MLSLIPDTLLANADFSTSYKLYWSDC